MRKRTIFKQRKIPEFQSYDAITTSGFNRFLKVSGIKTSYAIGNNYVYIDIETDFQLKSQLRPEIARFTCLDILSLKL